MKIEKVDWDSLPENSLIEKTIIIKEGGGLFRLTNFKKTSEYIQRSNLVGICQKWIRGGWVLSLYSEFYKDDCDFFLLKNEN